MTDRPQIRISDSIRITDNDLVWRYGPSGGPGGQHANTSNTRVELVWEIEPTPDLDRVTKDRLIGRLGPRVRIVVDETRSQSRNRSLALQRLEARVRDALIVPRKRRKTKPSRGSNERRLKAKKQKSQRKADRRNQFD